MSVGFHQNCYNWTVLLAYRMLLNLWFGICVAGQGLKMPSAFLDSGQDLNWFEEERKVHQLQKLMETEFKAWTQAERVAKINRTVIAEHVRLSEAKAREHMERATNLSQQAEDARHRCNVAKQVRLSLRSSNYAI